VDQSNNACLFFSFPTEQDLPMFLRQLASFLALSLALMGAASAAEPVSTGFFDNTAIGGVDTVSYADAQARGTHQAVKGSERFEVEYLGAIWRFASQASANKFAANPAAYVPAYNGFCSNALASDEGLVKTDGSVWEFFGGKLHLFYAERGRQRWLTGDWQAYNRKAAEAWAAILKKG
jgi:YHS domain-containing protein